jgi:replication-associated recombination protein RarA
MNRYNLTTKKGYDLFEVASALQKSIRRGLEDDAMYWSVELFNSNFGEYLWKRLKIISSEDVGLAEPNISANIQSLYQMYQEQAKKSKQSDDKNQPERLFLTHAVILLCRAEKSRLIDWALLYHWNVHDFEQKDIPDFALDKHNERGRKLGRAWKHFFDEGTWLENRGSVPGEDDYREKARNSISNPSKDLFNS